MAERLELFGPWFENMPHGAVCKKCNRPYQDDPDDDGHGTKLCYECFEESLEDFEEKRRERIARSNEY